MNARTLWRLPVANGVVDLKTGRLMPNNTSKCQRGSSPVPYCEDATCPAWESCLPLSLADQTASRTV